MGVRHGGGVVPHGLSLLLTHAHERGGATITTRTALGRRGFQLIDLSVDDWFRVVGVGVGVVGVGRGGGGGGGWGGGGGGGGWWRRVPWW